jgi:PKD repeat protein
MPMRPDPECGTSGEKTSNYVFIQIYPEIKTPETDEDTIYCKGENVAINIKDINPFNIYQWSFNNNQSQGGKFEKNNVTNSFVVTLVAKDENGCSSFPKAININVDPVTAGFTFFPSKIDNGEFVQFTNTSTNAASYLWNFYEGEKSVKENPLRYFYEKGQKDVKLLVTSPLGCKDSLLLTGAITVNGKVGIEDLKEAGIKVFPNPFNNNIRIDLEKTGSITVSLVNMQGKTILYREIENINSISLNCHKVPAGLYILKIIKNSKLYSLKVVKQ